MSPEHAALAAKLDARSAAELEAVCETPLALRTYAKHADLAIAGQEAEVCNLMLDGFAYRYKVMPRGERQILSFHIPGDMPDLAGLQLQTASHCLSALAPTRVAAIPVAALEQLIARCPRIGRTLWRETLIDAAVTREWLAAVGRRSAHQRVAHLICEIYTRMERVGLARGGEMVFSVTQSDLADALGLSTVHVNRVLQNLRRDRLIRSTGKVLEVLQADKLVRAGEFDPSYLNPRIRVAENSC